MRLSYLSFWSSHLHIFSSSSSHLHILAYSHPHIFTSADFTSSHLPIFSCFLALLPSLAFFYFFPSNAFMASARSSNTFNCMLQTRVNWLINAYMAACRLRGLKSELVKDLYIVQSVTKSSLPSPSSILCGGRGSAKRDGMSVPSNAFARNEVRSPKLRQNCDFQVVPRDPFARNGSIAKN